MFITKFWALKSNLFIWILLLQQFPQIHGAPPAGAGGTAPSNPLNTQVQTQDKQLRNYEQTQLQLRAKAIRGANPGGDRIHDKIFTA